MEFVLSSMKLGLGLLKQAIGLAKSAKDALPAGKQKDALESSLETAEHQALLAQAHLAQGLGYPLCQCSFPPPVMLKCQEVDDGQASRPVYRCPGCKGTFLRPPAPDARDENTSP